jgi:DNA-binding HxlR family transcriptional regulator
MATPTPGKRVRGSKTGRPIMALLDLLGRRWALRILWELRDGPLGFNELQARCDGMSPTSLSARLAELAEAGLVEERGGERTLTAEGRSLGAAFAPLQVWAERWAARRRQARP